MSFKGLEITVLANKEGQERVPTLVYPKDAVVADENGYLVIDPSRLERILVNPATEGYEHEPWPFAGLHKPGMPKKLTLSTGWVDKALAAGWIELTGEEIVHRPGGPEQDIWRVTHTFRQAKRIVFHFHDGDLAYKVTHNPDKYDDPEEDKRTGTPGGRVDWFYELERADG